VSVANQHDRRAALRRYPPQRSLAYLEIEDERGFVGNKASKGAFLDSLGRIRITLRQTGADSLAAKASDENPRPPKARPKHARLSK